MTANTQTRRRNNFNVRNLVKSEHHGTEWSTGADPTSLSVKDLLEAREAFHLYLSSLKGVVGTAIGRYRFRKEDEDSKVPDAGHRKGLKRTLGNSVVTRWSWPCILVFVKKWYTEEELKDDPTQVIPRFLHMSDGRRVRTCVIEAPKREAAGPLPLDFAFPSQLLGGGYPVFSEVQGQTHVGSLGCLVTDGDRTYCLTNRHVVGERNDDAPARTILALISGKPQPQPIGVASHKQVGKKLLEEVYKGWPGKHSFSVIDAGLIELTDVNDWTAQVYGIGELDEPVDLHPGNISLNLIGCPVRAFGGASGEMKGQIDALFYRYKAIGGFDYVSDLLIGPRDEQTPMMTRPGDSGTVWFLDPELSPREAEEKGRKGNRSRRLTPIALQWGGQTFIDGKSETELAFALATYLSTICRELDVDIVRGWNVGYSEYWGKLGHFKIAAKACELISNRNLKTLMQANLENVTFNDESIIDGELKRIDKQFVPLADVPDLVWRGRKGEGPSHYADMDEAGRGEFQGKTLLELTENPDNVRVQVWNRFYDSLEKKERGALPFRIWQIYNQMVEFARERDAAKFVCAAGIIAHYFGDACEPMHISAYYDGREPDEKGVHSAYETGMLDRCAAEIIAAVNQYLDAMARKLHAVKGGHVAAVYAVELMRATFEKLPPETVIEAYKKARHSLTGMFNYPLDGQKLGDRTAACIGQGCLHLASVWNSAWEEGHGNEIPDDALVQIKRERLVDLYKDRDFLRAYKLDDPKLPEALGG